MRRCTTRARSRARASIRCVCLGLVLASIAACNGETAAPPSVDVPTQPPAVTVSPSPVAVVQPTTTVAAPVAAAPRVTPTVAATSAPVPAPTTQAQPPPSPEPTAPPSTATPIAPSPSPSPALSPVASPSPSPSPTTPAATPSPETTERPAASPTAAPTPARAVVGRIATALTVDGLQRPQDLSDVFGLDDRVYISVEFRDVREGARLGIRWSAGSCGGMYETGPQQALRRGYFAFYVDETNCVGEHAVEITVDGAVAAETSFTVIDQPSVAR